MRLTFAAVIVEIPGDGSNCHFWQVAGLLHNQAHTNLSCVCGDGSCPDWSFTMRYIIFAIFVLTAVLSCHEWILGPSILAEN